MKAPGSQLIQMGMSPARVPLSVSSLVSSGLRRFCFFSGGPGDPIGLSGAFRLFDPDARDDDDMVGPNLVWLLVLIAYGVRQTPRRLLKVWNEGGVRGGG